MLLKRLKIDRLPGIDESFEIKPSSPGIHVIFGPNAIGKSSICRAVKCLYWDDLGPSERTSVTGQFELDGENWQAEREGSRLRWRFEDELRAPPGIPASHNHRSFFLRLRDLIDPSLDGTRDIASEIKRQMSGGYDLRDILENLFPVVSRGQGRNQRKEFQKAEQDVEDTERDQVALQRRANELTTLRARMEAAAKDHRRLPLVQRAIDLANCVEEQDSVTAEITSLPPALANLGGQELEQIDQFQSRIGELDDRIRTLEYQREAAHNAQQDSRLSAVVDKSNLKNWRQNAEELVRIGLELESAEKEQSQCHSEMEAALSALGSGNCDQVAFTLEEHHSIFNFLREADKRRMEKNAIVERLRLLETDEQCADGESRLEDLRAGIEQLRQWLRTPEAESAWDRLRARGTWILFAVAMAVVGAGMAFLVDPRFGLLLTATAGFLAPVLLMRGRNPDSGARSNAEKAYAKLNIEPPDQWNCKSVEERLRGLEENLASIESRRGNARDRDVERQNLNNRLTQVIEADSLLDEQRNRLLDILKLESMLPDAELVDMARALDQYRKARTRYEGAAGRVADLITRHDRHLSSLTEILQRHGEPAPENAAAAKIFLDALSDRNAQLAQAIGDVHQANLQLEQIHAERGQAIESISKVYAAASLENGDRSGMASLLEFLPEYRELKRKATSLETKIDLYRNELTTAEEAELADSDKATLERLAQELSAAESKADEIRNEIAGIEAEVKKATRGSDLEELIARREKARTELQDRRDEAIFATAGRFLVDSVEREYEQNQMPRVLERARNHFSEFTHHGYELRLSRDAESPRLYAIDLPSGEPRDLNQLSDGTRVQLLLAARMAFAEEIEQGEALPLFLDEALDQSDPARFEAIARSLARIAHDRGRQIFYLTSDPLDRDRIRHAIGDDIDVAVTDLDLGQIRKESRSVAEPATLQVPPRATIPAPDGEEMEDYGVKLGVPAFAPSRGYAQQNFFYVLPDDLPLLHEVLMNGIEQAGQWKTVSGTALAERLMTYADTAGEIDSRVRLLEVFCEAWNQGRGRTVDRDALVQSGAVSHRYLDDIAAISKELGNDPEQLVSTLQAREDPRVRGFRNSNVTALEEYLRDNGYLDDRPILDEGELTIRSLASPPANELPNEVARECLRRWWIWAMKFSVGE